MAANQEYLDILKQGVKMWNQWRGEHADVEVDLSGVNLSVADLSSAYLSDDNLSGADLHGANLRDAYLSRADLSHANLSHANLSEAILIKANLRGADLRGADLGGANLRRADLRGADLRGANLRDANLYGARLRDANLRDANLSGANLTLLDLSNQDLSGANLSRTILVGTNLTNTTLKDCTIYGVAAWDVQLEGAEQLNLRITPNDQAAITVDNLKIAQFIYLLLNNAEIREVIDTIAKKAVLILGRFTLERKAVLDALRDELRMQGYLPILFDFDKPASRDITETISTLAHLSRFVIADITDAKSIPQELMIIVPNLPSLAVQPLILDTQHEYGMFEHFRRFPWVLPVYRYADERSLLQSLQENVITPAEQKAKELEER